jgi:hypothetical protein
MLLVKQTNRQIKHASTVVSSKSRCGAGVKLWKSARAVGHMVHIFQHLGAGRDCLQTPCMCAHVH